MSQQPQHKPAQTAPQKANSVPGAGTVMSDNRPTQSEAAPEVKTETKSEAFRRLATTRTNNVLNDIRVLSNLGSPNYEYTPEQVEAIFAAIDRAVTKAKDVLKNGRVAADAGFSL